MKTSKRRFCGTLAYDGTRYAGFQRQPSGILTIQAELERAIAAVTGAFSRVLAAGRTDAGVHAKGQVIAFDCEWDHPIEALWRAINAQLPPDIALKSLSETSPTFHPRYDAVSREYDYQFYSAPVRDPLWDRMSWHVSYSLDLSLMQVAADMLIGVHDFGTFGLPPKGTVTIRRMYKAQGQTLEGGLSRFTFEADAFLQHMVRRIMGTLVEVGRGKMTLQDFAAAFAAADRRRAGPTAPPHGLILTVVRYRGESALESQEQ